VLFAFFRNTGCFPQSLAEIDAAAIASLARQLDVFPNTLCDDRMLHRTVDWYRAGIRAVFGFRSATRIRMEAQPLAWLWDTLSLEELPPFVHPTWGLKTTGCASLRPSESTARHIRCRSSAITGSKPCPFPSYYRKHEDRANHACRISRVSAARAGTAPT